MNLNDQRVSFRLEGDDVSAAAAAATAMNKIIISVVSTSPPTIPSLVRFCVYVCQTVVVGTHNDLSRDLIGASACILLYTVSNWSNCNATSIKINPHITIKTATWSYTYIYYKYIIEARSALYFTAIRPNDRDYNICFTIFFQRHNSVQHFSGSIYYTRCVRTDLYYVSVENENLDLTPPNIIFWGCKIYVVYRIW